MSSETEPAAEMVFRQFETLPEEPVSKMTVAGDQGWTRVMVSKAINGSPDIFASVFRMEPNMYHPMHAHPNVGELYFVIKGRVQMTVGGHTEWCEPGTAIYTPQDVPHCARTDDQGASVLVIFPEGDWEKVGKRWIETEGEADG